MITGHAEADEALREAMLAEHVRRVVDTAPPLTAGQRNRLALLLTGGTLAARDDQGGIMTGVAVYESIPVPDLSQLDWDGLVQLGRTIAYAAQWILGDLACHVETSYGEGELEKYAEAIGMEYDTLRRYRYVSRAYPENVPRGTHPWSVYRELAAEDDRLELVAADRMTVRQAQDIVGDRRRRRAERERRRRYREEAKAAEAAEAAKAAAKMAKSGRKLDVPASPEVVAEAKARSEAKARQAGQALLRSLAGRLLAELAINDGPDDPETMQVLGDVWAAIDLRRDGWQAS